MPRYYFHVYDEEATLDSEGVELADSHMALVFAYRAAREIAAETAKQGKLSAQDRIDIVDADRRLIDTVTFGEATGVEP